MLHVLAQVIANLERLLAQAVAKVKGMPLLLKENQDLRAQTAQVKQRNVDIERQQSRVGAQAYEVSWCILIHHQM